MSGPDLATLEGMSASSSDHEAGLGHCHASSAPSLHPHALHGGASAWTSDSFGFDRLSLQQALEQKSMLVMHMLAQYAGQECIMQVS